MNDLFKVRTLKEITFEHFEMAAVATMSMETELRGLLGVPCGDDFILYTGKGKSRVQLRNYCNSLELLVVSVDGTFLVYSKVDGIGMNEVIGELYRQLVAVIPFVNKEVTHSFHEQEITPDKTSRWMEGCEEVMKRVTDYLKADTEV